MGVPLDIEREFRDPQFKSWRGWRAGNRYLIQSNVFRFDVHRLQDLLHAYKKVTQHRYHFVIPVGKTYEAILYWDEGQAVISGRLKQVDRILTLLQQRTPWAIHGYSPSVEDLFKRDRRGLGKLIRERRAEWERRT